MNTLLKTTALGLVALGLSAPAMAQQGQTSGSAAGQQQATVQQGQTGDCQVIQQDFERQVLEDPEARAGYTGSMMRDLRMMRDTAWRLEQYGQTEACQRVAEAMQEIVNDPESYRDMAATTTGTMGTAQPGAVGTGVTGTAGGATALGYDERLQQQREAAVRVSELEGQLRMDELIGTDVRGAAGDSIGEVDDVVLDTSGGQSFLVVSYGGFLGIGENASAIPLDQARISTDRDVVFVDLTEEQLENAPTFDRGDYAWTRDENWLSENQAFYERD
ncbi:PRC-barrel domain-containing protein [Lutibaculum baratangense]|uniref:PRC-barrel domain-containing protein n=1 Tax=Lutibaculum baratangense AMV1 TaxID=631454 RepID=V4RFY7_9HYPH|nr:PRC-barrel domain-containing protein [Lutibaculum baratangense]ESR25061.1 hypothetical protein N177_1935 [Lutibaculum baratangense AMV1]